ncbi:uncharacterized protein G2W53_005664 [Senna tora]|uniref:Uncharacterized protein n=1 Tax=Senna tora TaxID=362788 RepID=A0A835CFS8_9FABA|nr:uncharacterized protein G2W53_005664 [Senna tora]
MSRWNRESINKITRAVITDLAFPEGPT